MYFWQMTRFFQLIALFFLCPSLIIAQNAANYSPPLDIPLTLAANFGELRPNHFHTGVDFKTDGREGLPLYAIQDGFVSRVKFSPTGYGKVIYINHPNGITSVYAHCSRFSEKLSALVNEVQAKEQTAEVEVYLLPSDVPVKRGERIAFSGNSGSSTGPHLHFELRDTKTEVALNPLKYGFDAMDNRPPELKSMKVYALTEAGYRIPGKVKEVKITKGNFGYAVPKNAIELPSDFCLRHGGVGLAVEAVDYLSNSTHACGLYACELMVDSVRLFQQQLNQVNFEHSRYVNSHKDYAEYVNSKRKFSKAFKTKHNPLTIYAATDCGVIYLPLRDSVRVSYKAYDLKNNEALLRFSMRRKEGHSLDVEPFSPRGNYFFPDSSYHFANEWIDFKVDKFTFYEPSLMRLSLNEPFQLGNANDPIQLPVHIRMKLPTTSIAKHKYYIVCQTQGGKKILATDVVDDWLVADTKNLGVFWLGIDTTAPLIYPMNFQDADTVIGKKRMQWKVTDAQTDVGSYAVFVNDEWHLLEYESKGSYVFFDFTPASSGVYSVELQVSDRCGNRRLWVKPVKFEYVQSSKSVQQ